VNRIEEQLDPDITLLVGGAGASALELQRAEIVDAKMLETRLRV
jgi:hypothetical protein